MLIHFGFIQFTTDWYGGAPAVARVGDAVRGKGLQLEIKHLPQE